MALLALGHERRHAAGGITADVVEVSEPRGGQARWAIRAKGKIVLYNKRIYSNGGDDRGYGSARQAAVHRARSRRPKSERSGC